jgi:BTB/POZ domain
MVSEMAKLICRKVHQVDGLIDCEGPTGLAGRGVISHKASGDDLDEILSAGTKKSHRSMFPQDDDINSPTSDGPWPALEKASCDDSTNSDEDMQNLSWRLDPRVSHSDWTIRILGPDRKATSFHVHKAALSVGHRKSQYFARTFQTHSTCNVTEIRNMTDLEVKALPLLLDYIYSGGLKISTASATALHALSRRFEIKSLHVRTKQYWTNDLNAKTAAVYFRHAKLLKETHIQKAIVKLCTKKLPVLLEINDMDLFLQVMDSFETAFSEDVSRVIATFCQQNMKQLDTALFFRITAPLRQNIDPKAAVTLLHVQQALPDNTAEDAEKKKDFALRCINILAAEWTTEEPIFSLLPGVLQERYLQKSIEYARMDYQNAQKSQKQLQQRNAEMERAVEAAMKRAEEAERVKEELERENGTLKRRARDLEQMLSRQKSVLERVLATLSDRFPHLACYGKYDEGKFDDKSIV